MAMKTKPSSGESRNRKRKRITSARLEDLCGPHGRAMDCVMAAWAARRPQKPQRPPFGQKTNDVRRLGGTGTAWH